MAHTRSVALLFATIACTTLPGQAFGQRAADYTRFRQPFSATGNDHVELRSTITQQNAWRPGEIALAGAFTAALLLDAAQTRRLARGGWRGFYETNPILGTRPSEGRINTYTAVAGLSVLGAAAVAPKRLRPWVLGLAFAVEAYALGAMSQRGVAIKF